MTEAMTRVLTIVNEKGLHARASAKLVELVEGFDAEAEVSKDGMSATGDSGADAAALADAIEALVADRFGEDM